MRALIGYVVVLAPVAWVVWSPVERAAVRQMREQEAEQFGGDDRGAERL